MAALLLAAPQAGAQSTGTTDDLTTGAANGLVAGTTTDDLATGATNSLIMSPTLGGDPRNPPQFRKPNSQAQSSDSTRVGEISNFGYQPALGAGTTGFDSTNDPRRKAKIRGKTKAGTRPRPTVAPASATVDQSPPLAQNGVTPPSQRPPRRGSAVPSSAPVDAAVAPIAVLRRKLPPELDPFVPPGISSGLLVLDPYEPLGIRAGSFLLRPAVELLGGYNNNPSGVPGGPSSSVYVVAPELVARSDWSRHELTANLRGSYTGYGNDDRFVPKLDRPTADAKVNGRIDVTSLTRIDLEGRFLLGTDAPNSPNLQAGLARLPIYTTVGTTAGVAQRFNRFELALKGTFDRTAYADSLLTDGTTSSNADRDYNQYGTQFRAGYWLMPGIKPFFAFDADRRVHDLPIDSSGLERDSHGILPRIGSTFALSSKLTGDFSVGYVSRIYEDPTLPKVQGLAVDGSLVWLASALTTATLSAKTTVNESTVPGVSGTLTRDYLLQIDHAFRRWLVGTLKLAHGLDDYVGLDRLDRRYYVSTALVYKLNREMQLKTELRQDWLSSNVSGVSFTASSVLFGLRLQR
jgi:hypothetical protein